MQRTTACVFTGLLMCTAGLLISLNACGGSGSAANPNIASKILHVVVIFQENRTPDNLFHDPALISAGADIASSGLNSRGKEIELTPISLDNTYDLSHSHRAFLNMYDDGKMDGANRIAVDCPAEPNCAKGIEDPQFKYVTPSDVAPYFQMAEAYTFADHTFQNNQGPSFPAHQFILSGTSAPSVGSPLFAAENPEGSADAGDNTGCTAPPAITVALIDPEGNETPAPPCYEHPTLTDLLNNAGISWRYYAPSPGSLWTAPNAIRHICVPDHDECTGADWTNNVVIEHAGNGNQAQILSDIRNGNLASVVWVIPGGQYSDHPWSNRGLGPSWVGDIVNAIGTSQYWSDTAIFVLWDDWGGWYDHVPPPAIINSYEYGFRVPMIVISPYVKPAHISHATHTFGSVLRYIEGNFGLPTLGYADAAADDLSDCFDYEQTPLTFQGIAVSREAEYFLQDKTPPTPPDDD